jgi:hypothetical protein
MLAMTKREQLIRIKDEYRSAHGNQPATARMMIDWAIDAGLYAVDLRAARTKGAKELADVLRSEIIVDEQGHRVRVNHSVETEQGHLWDDIRTISHEHMELSVAHGRNRIFGEVKAVAIAVRFYNELHADEAPIQTSFNFENDLADDGISIPSSIALEQLLAQPRSAAPESTSRPEPSRPASRPSRRASRRRDS